MPTSDFLLHKEVILTVQAGIFASIVILAVFAKVSDSKAAARVQRVAHKKFVGFVTHNDLLRIDAGMLSFVEKNCACTCFANNVLAC